MSRALDDHYQLVDIKKSIHSFCRDYFENNNFTVHNEYLSDFNYVFKVSSGNLRYIVKFYSFYNPISLIRINRQYTETVIELSEKVNKTAKYVKIPRYISILQTNIGTFFLMKEEKFAQASASNINLHKLGKALKEFHSGLNSTKNTGMIILPWNHFSPEFRNAFEEHNRWDVVQDFLYTYFPGKKYFYTPNMVINHNDIHAGNIYYSNSKYLFLDLNEMCLATPLNDIGIIVANYVIDPEISLSKLDNKLKILLKGYCNKEEINTYVKQKKVILVFALRKLFLIEGYFLYSGLMKKQYNTGFIRWLRSSQEKIKRYI